MMHLNAAYESQLAAISDKINSTAGRENHSVQASLAYDYIALSAAIAERDEFNQSINSAYPPNDTAFTSCRVRAISCFDQAIKIAGDGPVSQYLLDEGRIYGALGDGTNATQCFNQGIISATEERNNETLIGCLYLKAYDVDDDQAIKCYKQILTMDFYDPRIWSALSRIYERLGKYTEATEASDNANLFKYGSQEALPHLPSATL